MRLIITARAVVPEFKGIRFNKTAIADAMLRGWYDAGPHGSRTGSISLRRGGRTIPGQLGNPRNIDVYTTPDRVTAVGVVKGPYAAIQDQGGTIPARFARKGSVMKFIYQGATVFAHKVGPSRIRPKQYIVRGLRRVGQNIGAVVECVTVKKVLT